MEVFWGLLPQPDGRSPALRMLFGASGCLPSERASGHQFDTGMKCR
jgi:hypothetical protein